MGVTVYREQEKAFSVGDRIQFTAPSNDLKITNRELGTVQEITKDGAIRLTLDSGREMKFDPQHHPHLDHGYAFTSYSGQGQTADRVLINVDTELAAKDLLNNRMAYVSVSRGQWDAQIFTNDRSVLADVLSHDVSHQSALQPQEAIIAPGQNIAQSQQHDFGPSMDFGLGL
jgi:ATP-dependent exoDNAse (exonuclease V) alpha subunit